MTLSSCKALIPLRTFSRLCSVPYLAPILHTNCIHLVPTRAPPEEILVPDQGEASPRLQVMQVSNVMECTVGCKSFGRNIRLGFKQQQQDLIYNHLCLRK